MVNRKLLIKIRSALLALGVTFLLAVLALGFWRNHRIQVGFDSLIPGATERNVISELGRPSHIDRACAAYGTRLATNCDHVLIWNSSFAPLTKDYWLVFFNRSGIAKATSRDLHK